MANKMEAIVSNVTITANDLAGIRSQSEAKTVLKKLLQGVARGAARISNDATAEIEKFCRGLAESIRTAIFNWNHYQYSFISEP